MEHAIRETTATWEREGMAEGEGTPIIGAVDATCLSRLMLVWMDWASGAVRVEAVASERTEATWQAVGHARLQTWGAPVRSRVSDRAQALIKLAQTGLGCLRSPAVLPLLPALVQRAALAMGSRLRQARQALRPAQEHLAKLPPGDPEGTQTARARVARVARDAAVRRWKRVHGAYRLHLEALALIVPPWRVADSTLHTAPEVDGQRPAASDALEAWRATHGVPGTKTALAQGRRQLAALAALGALWGQGVGQDGAQHPLTPRGTSGLAWAAAQAKASQRASSASAGRHGALSQRHHHHRG